jgi:hypothetical protein
MKLVYAFYFHIQNRLMINLERILYFLIKFKFYYLTYVTYLILILVNFFHIININQFFN